MNKKFIFYVVGAALFLGTLFYTNAAVGSTQRELAERYTKMEQLQNQISIKEASIKKNRTDVQQEVSGLNSVRVKDDEKVLKELMSKVLTWDKLEEYNGARNLLIQTYQVPVTDRLLAEFMPKVESKNFGFNSKFEKVVDTRVLKIAGSTYDYFSIVELSSADRNGARATGQLGVFYSIDKNKKLSGLSAYILMP